MSTHTGHPECRDDHDTTGEVGDPARAVQNLPTGRLRFPRRLIRALALIKSCAAKVNGEQCHIDSEKASRIERVADEVANGRYDDRFPTDVLQTGSGASLNTNVNELIGRLSDAHPNDEVNRGMSGNDILPSALHIAAAEAVVDELLPAMEAFHDALEHKAWEFHASMLSGKEFSGYAHQIELAGSRIEAATGGIYELPLRGTASAVITELVRRTGYPYHETDNPFDPQASKDAVVFLSAALRSYAIALTKIVNDISRIQVAGKTSPVIAETVLMACAQVVGYDAAIAWCGVASSCELNIMMPIMAYDLIESIDLLTTASRTFADRMAISGAQAPTIGYGSRG
jgi:fumarate hydratase class II